MLTTLIIPRGLPGSGKTTAAISWVLEDPEHRARVNRDALREHTYCVMPVLGPAGEESLTGLAHSMVSYLLSSGRSVVVDDTNLSDRRVEEWERVAARTGSEVVVWDFRDVDERTCVERDAARGAAGGRTVGPDVIRRMASQHGLGGDK